MLPQGGISTTASKSAYAAVFRAHVCRCTGTQGDGHRGEYLRARVESDTGVQGFEFCYLDEKLTKSEALDFCAKRSLQLVEITTEHKDRAVTEVCSRDCTWLGLTCPVGTEACDGDPSLWRWTQHGGALDQGYNSMRFDGVVAEVWERRYGFCAHWFKCKGPACSRRNGGPRDLGLWADGPKIIHFCFWFFS